MRGEGYLQSVVILGEVDHLTRYGPRGNQAQIIGKDLKIK